MNYTDKQKLVSLLLDSIEGHVGFDAAMREIAKLESIKSNTVVASACHELRHFFIDTDLDCLSRCSDAGLRVIDHLIFRRVCRFVELSFGTTATGDDCCNANVRIATLWHQESRIWLGADNHYGKSHSSLVVGVPLA